MVQACEDIVVQLGVLFQEGGDDFPAGIAWWDVFLGDSLGDSLGFYFFQQI